MNDEEGWEEVDSLVRILDLALDEKTWVERTFSSSLAQSPLPLLQNVLPSDGHSPAPEILLDVAKVVKNAVGCRWLSWSSIGELI